MSKILIIVLLETLVLCASAAAYHNPLTLPNEAMGAGISDPGLFKWMGKFYLYASKVPGDPGIRCWESKDLANWTYKGFCTGDDPAFATGHAWSPGPFYYNGKFYLYVCGIDQKHKVFESDKPTGPFKCVNKNLLSVDSLDGEPFLDDDGQLYLFYAGRGIQYRKCSSPTCADGPNQQLKACQFSAESNSGFWSEGPTMYKHDGTYYLAYCGNDWLRDSYQVQVAKGRTIADLKPQKSNPLLIQLNGDWVAVGCNWIVRGPDLKSVWNVYHCRKFGGRTRRLCLDKLYFDDNGDMRSNGPTWDSQPNPALPDWYEDFDRTELGPMWQVTSGKWNVKSNAAEGSGEVLCKVPVGENAAAEFNICLVQGKAGSYGVSFTDDNGGDAAVVVDVADKSVCLVSKNAVVAKRSLPAVFDLAVWHQIVVERYDGRMNVFFDGMLVIDEPVVVSAGHFSLVSNGCAARFGWCGFSNYRDGEKP